MLRVQLFTGIGKRPKGIETNTRTRPIGRVLRRFLPLKFSDFVNKKLQQTLFTLYGVKFCKR